MQLNDGLNTGSPNVFTVTARLLRMTMEVNEKLNLLPRMQQSITKDHLLASTNDGDESREIVYRIVRQPSLGRILLENSDGSLSGTSRFTQNQINNNLVLYEQTEPVSGLTASDQMDLEVETQHAEPLKDVIFQIEISVGNFGAGDSDQMVEFHPIKVKEGSKAPIGPEHVDLTRLSNLWRGKAHSELSDRLKITVVESPLHGLVETEGDNSNHSRPSFFWDDLRKKRVFYVHDDSDTFSDSLTLGFYLNGDNGLPDTLLFNGTLDVIIRPVNDQTFRLLTPAPRLEVVQGQRAAITNENLNTTDPDNVPSDIVYEVIRKPNNGILVYGINGTYPIFNFTQEDIDKSLVYFVQDGTNDTGTFHFKVSDGKHKAEYKAFNIYVVPLSLELVNRSRIEVLQGSTSSYIRNRNLGAVTNGNREDIWYNVTREPQFGRIFLAEEIVTEFRQTDVDSEKVVYVQLDLTVYSDYFIVNLWNGEKAIEDQVINVSVIPLVDQRPFNATINSVTVITLDVLDASKLAEQTKGDPLYTVLKGPKYGVLHRKEERKEREVRERFRFSHGEVADGKITYHSNDIQAKGSIADSFQYMLTAPNVQPARGKFFIVLKPRVSAGPPEGGTGRLPPDHDTVSVSTTPSALQPTTPRKVADGQPTLNDTIGDSQILSGQQLIIVGAAVGLVVLLAIVAVAIGCRKSRKRKKKKRQKKRMDGKVPGSHTAQTELDASDHLPSNGSLSLSDDLPPPAPPTSPSSTGSRSGSATPRQRTLGSRCQSGQGTLPPPPPPPYLTEGLGDWSEVSPTVPTCKVTPLSHRDRSELGQTALESSFPEMGDREEWNRYDPGDIRYGPPGNLMLRKNQYWV